MKAGLLLPSVVLILTPLIPDVAACLTCRCAPQRAARDARYQADAVFSGRVVELVDQSDPPFDTTVGDTARRHELVSAYLAWVLQRRQVRLQVHRVWKGEIGRHAEVVTGSNPAHCGFAFEMGKDYLVYAYRAPNGQLRTNMCLRTRAVADAEADFAALGPGAPPPGTTRSERP